MAILKKIASGVLVAFLAVALVEAAVRVLLDPPPNARVVVEERNDGAWRLRALGISTDTPHTSPWNDPVDPDGNEPVLLLLGESAAAGFPFYPKSTPARWLEHCLEVARGRPARVVDAAIAGIQSDWMAEAARLALERARPDVVIVYAGNNEFLMSFLAVRRAAESPLGRLEAVARRLALYRVLRRAILGAEAVPAARPGVSPEGFFDPPLGELEGAVLRRFRANLDAILDLSAAAGARSLVIRPAAAARGFPPLSSVLRPGLDAERKWRFQDHLERAAEALRQGDTRRARAELEAAREIDPDVAILAYRLAELLDAEGRRAEALAQYERSLELDRRPARVNSKTAAVAKEAAAAHGVFFADANALLAAEGRDGPLGGEFMVDHCHLSIEGQYRLARAIALELARLGLVDGIDADRLPDFAAGMRALRISVSEALLPEVQLGFTALFAAYENPASRADQLARAGSIAARVLERHPDQPRALALKAFVAAAEGRADEALGVFRRVADTAPRVLRELEAAMDRWRVLARVLDESGLELKDGRVAVRGAAAPGGG